MHAACGASPDTGPQQPKQPPRVLTQTFLDAGQRDFHASRCRTCGMLYTKGQPSDEKLHRSFHGRFVRGVVYSIAQQDTVITSDRDGAVVAVCGSDMQRSSRVRAAPAPLPGVQALWQQDRPPRGRACAAAAGPG